MCAPCHKQWKKGTFCPDCNGVFGKSQGRDARGSSKYVVMMLMYLLLVVMVLLVLVVLIASATLVMVV